MRKHCFFTSLIVAMLITTPAQAFEFSVKSSVSDQDIQRACVDALSSVNAPRMQSYCRSFSAQQILNQAENQGYELMANANALMPLHSYYQSHKYTYGSSSTSPDAIRARTEWKANGLSVQDGHWLAAPKGRYIDFSALSRLSISAELVRADFATTQRTVDDEYSNYQLSFYINDKPYKYQAYTFGADFHYRYTVKWDGRIIYDGFVKTHEHFGTGRVCPTDNQQARKDCLSYSKKNEAGPNFLAPSYTGGSLPLKLLALDNSPLSEMGAYYSSDRFEPTSEGKFGNQSATVITAQRPDLPSYAGSFQVIEGGRATFAYKQLPLYTAAQQNAPTVAPSASSANTAQFLADQQYCAQYAKSTVKEDQAFRSGLGFIAGMAGYGEVANAINTSAMITGVVEGLSGRELDEANACMRRKGHTSIQDAAALDTAASSSAATYVPYTGGSSSTQPSPAPTPTYHGSASAYAAPQPTPSYQGSASAYGNAPTAYAPASQPEPQQQAALSGSASDYAQQPTPQRNNDGPFSVWPTQVKFVPPHMPERANRSGYCVVRYDLTAEGVPTNVFANDCSDDIFRRASEDAIKQFRFTSEAQEPGKIRTYVASRLEFRLQDENGNLLSPPNGYWGPKVTPPKMPATQPTQPAASVPQPAPITQTAATPSYDNPAQFAQAPAPITTSASPTPAGNKVGRIMLVDTDFGFVTAEATGLQIGDAVRTQTPSGQVISFTVAKQAGNGNYSLIPNNGASLDALQPGYTLMK